MQNKKLQILSLIILTLFLSILNQSMQAQIPAPKITASSVEEDKPDLQPGNVMDGNLESRWASEFIDKQWLQIDMRYDPTIYGLQIIWEPAFSKEYTVKISSDAKKWEEIFSTTKGKEGPQVIRLDSPVKFRYMRIEMAKRGTEWGNSIYEIELQTDPSKGFKDPEEVLRQKMEELSKRKWTMVWNDEFNSGEIDTSKWNFVVAGGGFGNNEHQFYTDRKKNARIEQGRLIMEAHKEVYKGSDYTSSKLFTEGKGDWLYGKFEARIKTPQGQGIWPAFWMMPTGYDKNYGMWPMCGEIDIMEILGHEPKTTYGTLHYGKPHTHTGKSYQLPSGASFADGFHVFTTEWEPGIIRWYVDGKLFSEQTDWFTTAPGASWPAPFDQKFYLQLNVAVGGNWPGSPDNTTKFPQRMEIDWVRVYTLDGGYQEVTRKEFGAGASEAKRAAQEDGDWIYNGEFNDGDSEWELGNYEGAASSMSVSDGVLEIKTTAPGGQDWTIQLTQTPLFIEQNKTYEVKFDAWSKGRRNIGVTVNQTSEPYQSYSGKREFSLSGEKETYSFTFKMRNPSDADTRLEFDLGMNTLPVYFDNVSVKESNDPSAGSVKIQNNTKIEAEDFDKMEGIDSEDCSEGGKNIGWFETGDYLEYQINVTQPGKYSIEFRVASESGAGSFDILADGKKVGSVRVPATGGWQIWIPMRARVNLPKGSYPLRIQATGPEFNLNWFKFRKLR